MQKGLEINFYDLFRHLMKKWAVLLVFVLIFGVAANFYGYHKAEMTARRERQALEEYALSIGTATEELPEYMTAELAELRGALTEEEASFVEAIAKLYMYRMWASDKINTELIVGEPDNGDLEIVQTLYYANEGVQSAIQVMTSAEKSYYNVLVKELSGTDMSLTEKDISVPGKIQPKWLIIGCVLGAFLGACMLSMVYILSGKLRSPEDMERPYGIPVLAEVKTGDEEKLVPVARGVARLQKEKQMTSIAICAAETPGADDIRKELVELLQKQGINVILSSCEPSSFVGDVAGADSVLFIEQIGKSRYRDIEYRVTACRNFCIPVAGCVVVE